MKTGTIVLPAVLTSLFAVASAHAAGNPRGVESDHVDAYDQPSPRTVGVFFNPLSAAEGNFGAEGDLVLGDSAAASLAADYTSVGGVSGFGAALGLPIFPQRVPFHGLYLHPRLSWAHVAGAGVSAEFAGVGATVGWEWTWRFGLSLRAGVGAQAIRAVAGDLAGSDAPVTVQPVIDATVGWVF